MTLEGAWHYFVKLIANSTIHKIISGSFLAFIGIIQPTDYIVFHMLIWLWVISMIFGTINGSIKYGFNLRKLCMGGAKIMVYGALIYFAKSFDNLMHINVWVNLFAGFMFFELLLSVFKHCGELGLPIPKKLIDFVNKQEKAFEDRFNSGGTEKSGK